MQLGTRVRFHAHAIRSHAGTAPRGHALPLRRIEPGEETKMPNRIASHTTTRTACLLAALLIGSSAAFAGSLSAGSSNSTSSTSSSSSKSSDSTGGTTSGATTEGPAVNSPASGQAASAGTTEPLSNVSQPERKLVAAPVQDSSGQPIGQVASVQTGDRGAPKSVQISLSASGGGKVVSIGADQLRYDAAKNVVVAQLSQAEISAMASGSATTAGTR